MSPIPKLIFIVPYRNRQSHTHFFLIYLSNVMKNYNDIYEIYFSHQNDTRPFNRGATKNIGFIAMKKKYPQHYKNITFIFNDIDTMPHTYLFDYETQQGTIKHFYGFEYALGGIVSINGADFENTNGYPNLWGWGMEDTILQERCLKKNIIINRDNFYKIGDPNILQLFDGISRVVIKKKQIIDNTIDGINTIYKLNYTIDGNLPTPSDNTLPKQDNTFFININTFITTNDYCNEIFHKYDLREPTNKITHSDNAIIIDPAQTHIDNWTDIPPSHPNPSHPNPSHNVRRQIYATKLKPSMGRISSTYSRMMAIKSSGK